jgi:hypothetical protein
MKTIPNTKSNVKWEPWNNKLQDIQVNLEMALMVVSQHPKDADQNELVKELMDKIGQFSNTKSKWKYSRKQWVKKYAYMLEEVQDCVKEDLLAKQDQPDKEEESQRIMMEQVPKEKRPMDRVDEITTKELAKPSTPKKEDKSTKRLIMSDEEARIE